MEKRDIDRYAEKGRRIIDDKPGELDAGEMVILIARTKDGDINALYNVITTAFYMGVNAGYNRAIKSTTSRTMTGGEILKEAENKNITIEEYLESIK